MKAKCMLELTYVLEYTGYQKHKAPASVEVRKVFNPGLSAN